MTVIYKFLTNNLEVGISTGGQGYEYRAGGILCIEHDAATHYDGEYKVKILIPDNQYIPDIQTYK